MFAALYIAQSTVMPTSKNKTTATEVSVEAFLSELSSERQKDDCITLVAMMRTVTGAEPKMWGPAIIGFGSLHLVYDSGRELDWFQIGFSPRKGKLAIYPPSGVGWPSDVLSRLGKHSVGGSCLYVTSLTAVDLQVMQELIESVIAMAST